MTFEEARAQAASHARLSAKAREQARHHLERSREYARMAVRLKNDPDCSEPSTRPSKADATRPLASATNSYEVA